MALISSSGFAAQCNFGLSTLYPYGAIVIQLCPHCHEIPRRLSLDDKPFPPKLMRFHEIWFGIDSTPDSFETQTQSLRRCLDCRRIFSLVERQGASADGQFHLARSAIRCQWSQIIALSSKELPDRVDGFRIEAERAALAAQERLLMAEESALLTEAQWISITEALHVLIESPEALTRFVEQVHPFVAGGLAATIFQWTGPISSLDMGACTAEQKQSALARMVDSAGALVSAIKKLLRMEAGLPEAMKLIQLARLHKLNIDALTSELIMALNAKRRYRVQISSILSALSVKTLLTHSDALIEVASGDNRSAAVAAERLLTGLISRDADVAPRLLRLLERKTQLDRRLLTLQEACVRQLKSAPSSTAKGLVTADQALDAAKSGNIEQMEALLDRGLRLTPSFGDWSPGTPLSEAAKYGREEMVNLVLEKGSFDVNAPAGKRRPLGWACLNGHVAVAKRLLLAGADPNLPPPQSGEKNTVALVVELNHPSLLAEMLRAGATGEHSFSEQSPLSLASELGRIDMVRLLLTLPRSSGDNLALLAGAKSGSIGVVSALIEAGLDVDRQNYAFETPLIIAAKHNHADLVDVLIQANANPRLRDIQGLKAIEYARMHSNAAMINSIEAGPRPKR